MAKNKPKPQPIDIPQPAKSPFPLAPWVVAFSFLSILLAVLLWFPIANIPAQFVTGANEGFSCYFEAAAASGTSVYGKPPLYVYANYPPVWFHLVGYLGILTRDMNMTGRWISLLLYLLIAVFMALIVQRLSDSWLYAAYAALCWLVWLASLDPTRIGMNDPHLPGVAFSVAGLYFFVRGPESTRWLGWSALAFAISLFTKHTLVAFPIAVAIQLFLNSRKRCAIWLAALAAACLVLLVITLGLDGTAFVDHLMLPRIMSPEKSVAAAQVYLLYLQGAAVAALIWAFRTSFGAASVLVWAFALGHGTAAIYCAGDGAGLNHFFDAIAATGMIVGVAMPGIQRLAEGARFPRSLLAILLTLPFFIGPLIFLPSRISSDLARYPGERRQMESEFASASKFMKSQPGLAICEDFMLCYQAGKPLTFDPFAVDQLVKLGRLREQTVVDLVGSRHFGVIELQFSSTEPMQPTARGRFSLAFMQRLFANYRLAYRASQFAIFIPKAG